MDQTPNEAEMREATECGCDSPVCSRHCLVPLGEAYANLAKDAITRQAEVERLEESVKTLRELREYDAKALATARDAACETVAQMLEVQASKAATSDSKQRLAEWAGFVRDMKHGDEVESARDAAMEEVAKGVSELGSLKVKHDDCGEYIAGRNDAIERAVSVIRALKGTK